MRIGYFQFDKTNPFQTSYYRAVGNAGGEVVPLNYSFGRQNVELKTLDVLHLDWLHPFYKTRRGPVARWLKKMHALSMLAKLKRQCGVKIIHTVHNLCSHDSFLSSEQEQRTIQRFVRLFDAFAVFNEAVFDRFAATYDLSAEQNHFVTPHGHYIDDYDYQENRDECRARLGLPLEPKVVLFFGSLRSNKGIHDLIDIFPEIHQNHGAELVIAGGGMEADLDGQVNTRPKWLHINSERIADHLVGTYFGAADLVVLPFRSILNSGSAILAASLAKFLVIPNIASVYTNLTSESYQTFRAADKADLLQVVANNVGKSREELRARGIAGRDHVRIHLSWDETGRSAMEMYGAVAASHN